jgi:hypothetical protein
VLAVLYGLLCKPAQQQPEQREAPK